MVQCYFTTEDARGAVKPFNSAVCLGSGSSAGFYQCCFPWDHCLPDGLCYSYNATIYKTAGPTFYTSLCTDPTLQDSACSKFCGGNYHTGLQYNDTSNQWICCDRSDPKCSVFTNSTYKAPPPASLFQHSTSAVDYIPSSTASSTATKTSSILTSSTSSSQVAADTPAPQNGASAHLGAAAIAGISVFAVIFLIAVLGGVAFFLRRRGKKEDQTPMSFSTFPAKDAKVSKVEYHYVEMDANSARRQELDGRIVYEMR